MALPNITWDKIGKINVIIGENSCGKTSLLKAMYSAVKSIEDYKREDNN
ncbi:MAG: AAA family ATPase [Desulfovibrionaceae bacterium]|nr:AAA family ATPase [Desulfovibrionaceae bacterium]